MIKASEYLTVNKLTDVFPPLRITALYEDISFWEGDNNPYALNDDNHKFISSSALISFPQTGIPTFLHVLSWLMVRANARDITVFW